MIEFDDPLDMEVLRWLTPLRDPPTRNSRNAAQGLVRFLNEVRTSRQNMDTMQLEALLRDMDARPAPDSGRNLNGFHRAAVQLRNFAIAAVFIGAVFLGGSVTALAASDSLPGDAMYAVKTSIEGVEMSLSRDVFSNAELHMVFARRRVNEITSLAAKGRFEEIHLAAEKFDFHRNEAIHSLGQAAEDDPTRAQDLANSISVTLSDSSHFLDRLISQMPESAAASLAHTLDLAGTQDSFGASIEINGEVKPMPDSDPSDTASTQPDASPMSPTPTVTPTSESFSLEIHGFKVTKKVKLEKSETIEISLEVKNSGHVEGVGLATIVGIQNDLEIYRVTLDVTDEIGEGSTRYDFPPYLPVVPGSIHWSATLSSNGFDGIMVIGDTEVDP